MPGGGISTSSPPGLRPWRPLLFNRHPRRRRRLSALVTASSECDGLARGLSACGPELLLPALGIGSAAALFLSASRRRTGSVGDWVLVATPTPFNQSVFLRCPAVSGEGFPSAGPIVAAGEGEKLDGAADIAYQRTCVALEDGGVIALDWPEHLDLAGERQLDSAVLVIAGTPEGSHDGEVRAFVREALVHGIFPVVMNPRGCASSPLTTPRLFSAADSDDVGVAVRFICKKRPWTTLMAIGWEYGANMLTKYLAEMEERTPIIAAVCIDNHFDLNEGDDQIREGLVEILRANKEMFRGKNKSFDVERGLSARSLREFETAISMVSLGFESVKEFYSKSSLREIIHKVKIPLLFIQNTEDPPGSVDPVTWSSIEENPFASLILCSYSKNRMIARNWSRNLATEWFCAAELVLLKLRHSLVKEEVNITITPQKSLPISKKGFKKDVVGLDKLSRSSDLKKSSKNSLQDIDNFYQVDHLTENGSLNTVVKNVDLNLVSSSDGLEDKEDQEKGQVLGAANVILNMLDLTMPGTLDAEQKNKILTATDQGETFMSALNEAVPEEVRGKLNSAVSGIIQAQGSKIDFSILKRIGSDIGPNSYRSPKIREDPSIATSDRELHQDSSSVSSSLVMPVDIEDSKVSTSKSDVELRRIPISEEEGILQDTINDGNTDNDNSQIKDTLVPEDLNDVSSVPEDQSSSMSTEGVDSDVSMPHSEVDAEKKTKEKEIENSPNTINDKISEKETHQVKENKVPEDLNDAEKKNLIEGKTITPDSSSVGSQLLQKQGTNIPVSDSGNIQRANRQLIDPPSISVSKALDALTGFDDSTQMAVSSVFGVIENMIDQLEKEKDKTEDEGLSKDEHEKSEDTMFKDISGPRSIDPEKNSGDQKIETREYSKETDADKYDNFADYNLVKAHEMKGVPLGMDTEPYHMPFTMSNLKYFDPETTMDLFLDPDEGQWKMVHQKESSCGTQEFEDNDSLESTSSVQEDNHNNENETKDKNDQLYHEGTNEVSNLNSFEVLGKDQSQTSTTPKNTVVAGAVTMALGASALMAQNMENACDNGGVPSGTSDRPTSFQDTVDDKARSNFVSSLAEKAMSVAAPVVPTKDDGEVDHERIVASLAELGQKGGILRLIGKAALLWGGMRGAMSLTDRLISFLRIAQRPLVQRIFGFFGMVLIMWSPVVVPLLPTIVENWRLTRSRSVAEYACIWGLYAAIFILIILWGRRIRDYDDPLKSYGLDLSSPKVGLFLKGFFGGVALVFYAHSINELLGFVSVNFPPLLSSPQDSAIVMIKAYGWALIKALQVVATAGCAAAVEELLFRSWLVEEMAVDLGHFRAILLSGLVFSVLQGSVQSVPGFWLLSLALSGAKQGSGGSLFLPIGIRSGIMAVNSAVQVSGLLRYSPDTPVWLVGSHPWRPFDGAVGLAVCLLTAVYLRPRKLPRSDAKP